MLPSTSISNWAGEMGSRPPLPSVLTPIRAAKIGTGAVGLGSMPPPRAIRLEHVAVGDPVVPGDAVRLTMFAGAQA